MDVYTSEAFRKIYRSNTCTKKKTSRDPECVYSDDIFTFDLEASSGWVNDYGYIIPYDDSLPDTWYNNHEKVALCYIWQFGYNNNYFYMRDLKDFTLVLNDLKEVDSSKKIIYIHNASYEWQWLLNIWADDVSKVFARQERKLMYWEIDKYNIQVRCSYMLTNKSLELWGDSIGVPKMVGYLDYNKEFRTPLTHLSDNELLYCEHDLKVMYHGLLKYKEEYVHIYNIPITSTGEVRRDIRKGCSYGDSVKIAAMQPKTTEEYLRAKYIYFGGDVHTYAPIASRIVGDGESWDLTSDYPEKLTRLYPCYAFRENISNNIRDTDKYAYIIHFCGTSMKSKYKHHYLSTSRLTLAHGGYGEDIKADNGRLISCGYFECWCTEIDLEDIKRAYMITDFEIIESWYSKKSYIPKYIISTMLDYYGYKTKLKGVKDELSEELYAKSKNRLNAIYGMCCTDLINQELTFYDREFHIEDYNPQEQLDELQEKKHKNFLSYYFGCWCTAYARHELWSAIFAVEDDKKNKDSTGKKAHVYYFDTDSVKVPKGTSRDYFERRNKEIIEGVYQCLDFYNIPREKATPKDIEGVEHPLGVWDFNDGKFTEAVFLGAKRYIYRDSKDGKLHLTVAGVPKKSGAKALHDDITRFKDGFTWDYPDINKLLVCYLDGNMRTFTYKGYTSTYKYGINMRPSSYCMDINDAYLDIINYYLDKEGLEYASI